MRNDLSSRIEAERQRREKERSERAVTSPTPGSAETPGTTPAGATAAEGQTPTGAAVADLGKTLGAVGSGIGSFFGSKYASLRGTGAAPESKGLRPMSLSPSKR